jgi:phospholipase D1/2
MSLGGPRSEGFGDLKAPQTIDEKADVNSAKNELERPQSDLAKQETLSSIDEKVALKTASEPHLVSTAVNNEESLTGEDAEKPRSASVHVDYSEAVNLNATSTSQSRRRRRRATTIGSKGGIHGTDEVMDKQRAEDLLNKVQGHLILWPYDWYDPIFSFSIYTGIYAN